MTLESLKLRSSDLIRLRCAAFETIDPRIKEILNELADRLQDGINALEDEQGYQTLHEWDRLTSSAPRADTDEDVAEMIG